MILTTVLGICLGLIAFVIAAVALVRRSERRLNIDPNDPNASRSPEPGGASQIAAYLDRMTATLDLPAADVADVRAELADHLRDSVAALQAEGFEREAAIREALGRLGPAAELSRQLGAAHQSTRRLLAGAGGGIFAAGGGFVLGWFGAVALAYVLLIIGAALVGLATMAGLPTPNFVGDTGDMINSLIWGGGLMLAAGTATRYAVRTSAGLSRRAPRNLSAFWAIAAGLVFGWFAIFGMHGPQSWPGVVLCACVPVVAVTAAIVRIDRPMPHVGRWAVMMGVGGVLTIVVSLVLLTAVSGSSGSQVVMTTIGSPEPDMHFDTVAPMAPEAWNPQGSITGGGSEGAAGGSRFSANTLPDAAVPMATALTNWHDLRFEAWHALLQNPADYYGVDPAYSAPFAVQPAVVHDTYIDAVFHFEKMRDARSYWVVLTAVGPDGRRYRLENGGGGMSSFNGSVWDWLTAQQ